MKMIVMMKMMEVMVAMSKINYLLLSLLLHCAGNLEPISVAPNLVNLQTWYILPILPSWPILVGGGGVRLYAMLAIVKSWSSMGVARLSVNVTKLENLQS